MKTKFKFLIVSITMLLFISCEKEIYDDALYQDNLKLEKFTFSTLIKNEKFITAYSKIMKTKTNDYANKTVMEEQYGFTIVDEPVHVLQNDTITSYTMLIKREENPNNVIENLIIQTNQSNQITANIIKYTGNFELYNGFDMNLFQGIKSITPIEYNDNSTDSTAKIIYIEVCKDVIIWHCYGPAGHTSSEGCTMGYGVVETICYDVAIDSGGGGGLPGDGGGGSISDIVTSPNSGGGGGSPSNLSNELALDTFLAGLNQEQLGWWNNTNNQNEVNNILIYLENNNYSLEATNFINNLINDIINNENNSNPLPSDTILEINTPVNRINNIDDYLKCFNLSQSASFTIYVDQPTPNSNEAWSGNPIDPNVGHTFISITQGGIRRVLGYYPSSAVDLSDPSSPGSFENDGAHEFDVAISVNINSTKLTNLINYIKTKASSTYNLNTYNCSDFGMGASSIVGMPLGSAYGSWGVGGGDNPGQLGQNIRNMPTPNGGVKTTTTGNAASNIGTCN